MKPMAGAGPITLTLDRAPAAATECDLMEENDATVALSGRHIRFAITPYEIRTFKVSF